VRVHDDCINGSTAFTSADSRTTVWEPGVESVDLGFCRSIYTYLMAL
jgi:hypothetical protein